MRAVRKAVPRQLAAANALTGSLRWVGMGMHGWDGGQEALCAEVLRLPGSHILSAEACGAGCALPRAARCSLGLPCPVI